MRMKTECLGGGRIQHDRLEKKILVYGYSVVGFVFRINQDAQLFSSYYQVILQCETKLEEKI